VTEQGRGMFVRPRPPVRLTVTAANYRRHRAAGLPGFNAQVTEQDQRPGQLLVEVVESDAPAEIAERLQIHVGAPVIARRRLFLVNDEPVATCDSYYDAEMVRGSDITRPRLIRGGAVGIIEDPAGPIRRTVVHTVDDLTARMPTPCRGGSVTSPLGDPCGAGSAHAVRR